MYKKLLVILFICSLYSNELNYSPINSICRHHLHTENQKTDVGSYNYTYSIVCINQQALIDTRSISLGKSESFLRANARSMSSDSVSISLIPMNRRCKCDNNTLLLENY